MKDSFVMLTKWRDTISLLTHEQKGKLLDMCMEYHASDTVSETDPMVLMAFSFMRQYFDDSAEKYAARIEANRLNGKRGGRPKKEENPENPSVFFETQEKQGKAKKPDYDYDFDYESDFDSVPSNEGNKARTEVKKGRKKAKEPKEPKVQWADNVTMTNDEHQNLLDTYGAADTSRLIEILDNYKGATGKRYTSDYRAILSWCVERLEEEKAKGSRRKNGPSYTPPSQAERMKADEDMNRMMRVLQRMREE